MTHLLGEAPHGTVCGEAGNVVVRREQADCRLCVALDMLAATELRVQQAAAAAHTQGRVEGYKQRDAELTPLARYKYRVTIAELRAEVQSLREQLDRKHEVRARNKRTRSALKRRARAWKACAKSWRERARWLLRERKETP